MTAETGKNFRAVISYLNFATAVPLRVFITSRCFTEVSIGGHHLSDEYKIQKIVNNPKNELRIV